MKPAELRMELCSALLGTNLVQPVDSGVEKGAKKLTVWALCRQVPGGEKAWIATIDKLLALELEATGAGLHVCRRYVRRGGRIAFGWYLSVMAPASAIEQPLWGVLAVLAESKMDLHGSVGEAPPPAQQPALATQPPTGAPDQGLPQPRSPGPMARVGQSPPGYDPNPRVTVRTVDPETGRSHVETEMPLPFVYGEMNKPNAKGRGAMRYSGSGPGGR